MFSIKTHKYKHKTQILFTLIILFCTQLILITCDNDMYCGEHDCYHVLDINSDANASQIKKAFYKLSLQWHPDKNKSPEASGKFREIATAYEVLSDPNTRRDYDYMRAHPEEFVANRYRYYRYQAQQVNIWYVIGGVMLFANVSHYLYWESRYKHTMRCLRDHPIVKARLKQMNSDSNHNKKHQDSKRESEFVVSDEELKKIVQVDGWQGRRPGWSDVLIFWLLRKIYVPFAAIYWLLRWQIKFKLLKHPYGPEEEDYITSEILKVPWSRWEKLPADQRSDLVSKKLWIRQNMIEFKQDMAATHSKRY